MKTFQEFLEQAGSPSMSARKKMYLGLERERIRQNIKQKYWRQRHFSSQKERQDAEMHADAERTGALP